MPFLSYDIREKLVSGRDFKAPVIAQQILDAGKEEELVSLVFDSDTLLSNRAMWIVDHCSDLDYDRIKPFHSILINHLKKKDLPHGVIRCILSLFQKHNVPEEFESFMLDKCYDYIKSPSWAIAVRAFAVTVAYNISKAHSELVEELVMVLKHLSPTEETPAMKARIKNTLKQIQKNYNK